MQLLMLHRNGFQSTLPVRGATAIDFTNTTGITISIHAPREGSDLTITIQVNAPEDFNPRSP